MQERSGPTPPGPAGALGGHGPCVQQERWAGRRRPRAAGKGATQRAWDRRLLREPERCRASASGNGSHLVPQPPRVRAVRGSPGWLSPIVEAGGPGGPSPATGNRDDEAAKARAVSRAEAGTRRRWRVPRDRAFWGPGGTRCGFRPGGRHPGDRWTAGSLGAGPARVGGAQGSRRVQGPRRWGRDRWRPPVFFLVQGFFSGGRPAAGSSGTDPRSSFHARCQTV